jgi:hypothetical protein
MKTRIIILVSAVLTSLGVCGQDWIGNHFTLDTIVEFQGAHAPGNLNLIQCRMFDGTFYFVEQQGFQYKENGHQAVIHTLSTDNYEQSEIVLPLPESDRNKERYAHSLWIYDFSFDGDHILLTTQDELILYKQIHNQIYQVESSYRHPNLFMGYIHRDKVNFFEEDHDKGFKWFQKGLGGDSAVLVRELPYEAPHTVQIQPNRYLFHTQQNVFYLSTRHPRVVVYNLDGTLRDSILFDLPHWKVFGDEYIRKTLSVPYGIERIYAVKDELYDYSYPKVVMPLRGDLLLLYMQFDTITGKSALQYAIRTPDGLITRHPRTNHEDSVYTARRFPFTLFQGGLDKGHADGSGKIVQLTYKTDVPWQGKRHSEYMADVNQYFAENNPALAYKVMRYTPSDSNPSLSPHSSSADCRLFTPGGRTVFLDSLPTDKSVLVLHQGLECSGCVKAVYTLLAQTPMREVHIGQVYPQPINGLSAHELDNRIRQQLNKPFSLYYDTSAHYRQFSPTPPLQDSDFPCLILYQRGKEPAIYRNSDLFTPNYSVTEFSPTFLNAWQAFLKP